MPIEILMPALSPTMEEGNVSKWLKKEGDKIVAGDVIAEIETDKATMEVEAVDDGTLARIMVPAGTEGVKVNTPIAVLAVEGEDIDKAGEGVGEEEPAAAKPADSAAGRLGAAPAARPAKPRKSRPPKRKPPRLRQRPRWRSPPIPTFLPAPKWCR